VTFTGFNCQLLMAINNEIAAQCPFCKMINTREDYQSCWLSR
jgi:hypothetical protein